ncbi:AAA family ATPase, partial [Rhodococcus chondri]
MRLHSLEITAFGPFAETVRIDFDELGADGLFLLHGQTGAGKTSILDAVAFALYGTVPGARADGRRLLSDHAPAGTAPRVRLEATIAGRRLCLERSPEYERPKLRGTGTVKQQAKATLEWLDGAGENLSRIPDIGDAVKALLGMSAEQFFQVVLLPQGDFAKFLRADSDERGKLLERLFDTTRFGDVEQWFKDRRGAGAKRLTEQQKSVDVLAAKVAAAAGIEAGADADPVEWAHRLLADAADTRDETDTALGRARRVDQRNRSALDDAVALEQRLRRRAAAHTALATLDSTQPERQQMLAERDAAHRAVPVVVVDRDARRAVAEADAALRAAEAATTPLADDDEGRRLLGQLTGEPADTDRDTIRPRCEQWSAETARLDALLEEQHRISEIDTRRQRLNSRRDVLTAEHDRIVIEQSVLPEHISEATAAVSEAEKAAAALPGLVATRDRAADALGASVELQSRRTELEAAEQKVAALHTAHNDARTVLLDIRERRIAGMAAELASHLVPGDACVVCGSVEHPAPAQPSADTVTKTDEERAHSAEQRAAAALSDARTAVTEIANTVAVLRERCNDGTVDALASAHEEAVRAHDATAATAARLDRCRGAVDEFRRRESELQQRARQIDTDLGETTRDLAVFAAEADEIGRRIAAVVGDAGQLAPRRKRVAILAAAATDLLDARLRAAHTLTVAQHRVHEAEKAAADAGFADVAEACAAQRPSARIDEIDRAVRNAENERAVATSVLAEPEIAALTGDETADVAAAREAVTLSAAALDAALATATEAHRRHT